MFLLSVACVWVQLPSRVHVDPDDLENGISSKTLVLYRRGFYFEVPDGNIIAVNSGSFLPY